MPIVLECPQGHKLRVKDDVAGKKIRCPKCQAIIRVGKKSESPSRSDDEEWSDFESPEPAAVPAASRSAMPRKPGRPDRAKKGCGPAQPRLENVPAFGCLRRDGGDRLLRPALRT